MNLRDRLREILPDLLPRREEDAIKGRELISRVREVLGDTYSDGSLLTQFSLLSLEEDSCLARISNGQGYYLRYTGDTLPSLHEVFAGHDAPAETPLHRALALAVRLYDTAGQSVFVYPVEEDESWSHPDLVAVQWPAGRWGADGAYCMAPAAEGAAAEHGAAYRAVCVELATAAEPRRRAFFRALACGQWAQESELLLIGRPGEEEAALAALSSRYGVGVRYLAAPEQLATLPRADAIFHASEQQARELLAALPHNLLTHPRHHAQPLFSPDEMPDVAPVLGWAGHCVARGRVEPYERRVAVT